MTEDVVVQFRPEEEFLVTVRAVVGAAGWAVDVKHVTLETGSARESRSAEVAREGRISGEGVLDEVLLEFQPGVEALAADVAAIQGSFAHEVGRDVSLDLGLTGKHQLALDALVAPRWVRMVRMVRKRQAVLTHVGLHAARSHSVGDELLAGPLFVAETARVEQFRRKPRPSLEFGVVGAFVLGQQRQRRAELVADVALDFARVSSGGRKRIRRLVVALHVRFQLRSGLARVAAIGAVEAQVQHAGRKGGFFRLHLFRRWMLFGLDVRRVGGADVGTEF